jgi:hypothetical protein
MKNKDNLDNSIELEIGDYFSCKGCSEICEGIDESEKIPQEYCQGCDKTECEYHPGKNKLK